MLKAGDPAPDFTLPADDGGQFTLSSLRGRNVLLWFFPEAGTPGCSLEGRGLRDHREYFDESAIEVVGVSFDCVADNSAQTQLRFPAAQRRHARGRTGVRRLRQPQG
jgi:peroxiredoxin